MRLVKGSHIVVPKFWDGPQAYLLQNDDKRVIFVNPYEGDLALIGTTDIPYDGQARGRRDRARARSTTCSGWSTAISSTPLQPSDVVHRFSGVRPLYDDNAEQSRPR